MSAFGGKAYILLVEEARHQDSTERCVSSTLFRCDRCSDRRERGHTLHRADLPNLTGLQIGPFMREVGLSSCVGGTAFA